MNKNYYLSWREQEVFELISSKTVNIVTTNQLKDLFPRLNINKICYSLEKKNYLFRLKKGVYLIQREASKKPMIEDPFLIPEHLYKGYLAFSTALKIHGLLEYEPFTIFFVTDYKSKTFSIAQYTFKIINLTNKAEGVTKTGNYIVSNLEKTFFDCFYKPNYAGGYQNIVKALYDAKLNWLPFLNYFKKFASASLFQKTGYVIELMSKKTDYKVPRFVIDFFKKRKKVNTKLLATGSGHFVKEWKVIDNSPDLFGWY